MKSMKAILLRFRNRFKMVMEYLIYNCLRTKWRLIGLW